MQWLARSLTGEDWREDAGEVIDCGIHLHLPETTDEPWSWEPSCTTARNAGSWLLVMPGHSYFHSSVESCLVLREQLSSAATKIHSMSFKMAVELREWFAVTRSTFYSWRRMKLQFTGWVLTPPNTDAWVFSLHLQAFPRIASCAWRLTVESKERECWIFYHSLYLLMHHSWDPTGSSVESLLGAPGTTDRNSANICRAARQHSKKQMSRHGGAWRIIP
jgi:hypothetical protein